MPKFKRKETIIEAEQYNGEAVRGMCIDPKCFVNMDSIRPHVHTVHNNQPVHLQIGDWVIPEKNNVNFYPCKPGVFAETYESVEGSELLNEEVDSSDLSKVVATLDAGGSCISQISLRTLSAMSKYKSPLSSQFYDENKFLMHTEQWKKYNEIEDIKAEIIPNNYYLDGSIFLISDEIPKDTVFFSISGKIIGRLTNLSNG